MSLLSTTEGTHDRLPDRQKQKSRTKTLLLNHYDNQITFTLLIRKTNNVPAARSAKTLDDNRETIRASEAPKTKPPLVDQHSVVTQLLALADHG